MGAALALVASVATWFVAIEVIGALGGGGLDVQAATGLLAIAVLLVVMNWFFHKVYWTGWIAAHNRRRRALLGTGGLSALTRARAPRLHVGVPRRLRGRPLPAEPAAPGRLGHGARRRLDRRRAHRARRGRDVRLPAALPYRRMLVATGVLLGFVLLVMVGETIQELQLAGWLPTTSIGVSFPGFVNLWFATFPTVEGLVAQAVAAALVIGSYFLAEHVRVRAPRARAARQPAASQSS